MVKNVIKVMSVLAFTLSLNSQVHAVKTPPRSEEERKCPPLKTKKREPEGRFVRKDGSMNRALTRHLVRILFPSDSLN